VGRAVITYITYRQANCDCHLFPLNLTAVKAGTVFRERRKEYIHHLIINVTKFGIMSTE